jgi:hypothetical protein
MTARNETQQLAYVDRVMRAVFGGHASRVSRKLRTPDWLIGRETDACIALLKLLQKWGSCRAATSSFNRLLRPSEWILDGRYTVFAIENQGACRWAIDLNSSRLSVWQQPAGSTEWYREPSDLLPFLVTFCFWNAVHGGLKHCVIAEPVSPRSVGRDFVAVESSPWRFDRSTRLYYADGAAVFCSRESAGWRVYAGFRLKKSAAQFDDEFAFST